MSESTGRLGTTQKVTTTVAGTAVASANPISTGVNQVRVVAVVACFIKIDNNPVAVNTGVDVYMPAGIPEVFTVTPGQKISAISLTGSGGTGDLFITELV